MISKNKIKNFVKKKYSKKIGEDALDKIEKHTEDFIKELIEKAIRKASLSGRVVIRGEDVE
jgi:histone H3/H4